MIALIQEVAGIPREPKSPRDPKRSLTSVLRCYAIEQMLPYYPLKPPSPTAQSKRRAR